MTLQEIGEAVRTQRLSMNLRMEDVAKKANISRVTLYNIEKGNNNYSVSAIFNVLNVLDMYMSLGAKIKEFKKRDRATRINTIYDKKVNHFVIFCVENYAAATNQSSAYVYKEMKNKGVIAELTIGYEDLHGMSTMFLNQYIGGLLEE